LIILIDELELIMSERVDIRKYIQAVGDRG